MWMTGGSSGGHLLNDSFKYLVNDLELASGPITRSGPVQLKLQGGNDWSRGTTEFWGFQLRSIDRHEAGKTP